MKILNNDNKLASLISFFLSKYDREALKYLGYSSFIKKRHINTRRLLLA